MESEVMVAGIDAARSGWIACVVTTTGQTVEFRHGSELGAIWDDNWATVGIDMPMGLPVGEPRQADQEARRLLGDRRSTLFPTPVHATLESTDYPTALARSRETSGRGLSKQAFHLLPRVRELRAWLGGPRPHVHEVHPETSFTVLNGGIPLTKKSTTDGREIRSELLSRWRPALLDALARCPASLAIDALDAAAAAWTAERIATGRHRRLGDGGRDPDGYALVLSV